MESLYNSQGMYFCLNLENVSKDAEDWLSHRAFDFGAQGISEVLSFHQEEGEEDVVTLDQDIHNLHVYFDECPDDRFVQELTSRYPTIKWTMSEESDRDWLAEWKKSFHPFELVKGIWVVPSWLTAPQEASQVLWLEPGMAFGTGTHETTQLVAGAMANFDFNGKTVLDVGTGTGILAIAAKMLGASEVVGIDTDPEALRVARENFESNQTAGRILNQTLEFVPSQFDFVLANIIDGVLVRIKDDLFSHVKSGGYLIVSGILLERESHFLSHFHLPEGARWVERFQKNDWIARVLQVP